MSTNFLCLKNCFTYYFNSVYKGENFTQSSTQSAELHFILTEGTSTSKGCDIADGKVYYLREEIFVEARIADNTDKFKGKVNF